MFLKINETGCLGVDLLDRRERSLSNSRRIVPLVSPTDCRDLHIHLWSISAPVSLHWPSFLSTAPCARQEYIFMFILSRAGVLVPHGGMAHLQCCQK